jgi:hypothetical protein
VRVFIRKSFRHNLPSLIVSLPYFRHGGHCPVR